MKVGRRKTLSTSGRSLTEGGELSTFLNLLLRDNGQIVGKYSAALPFENKKGDTLASVAFSLNLCGCGLGRLATSGCLEARFDPVEAGDRRNHVTLFGGGQFREDWQSQHFFSSLFGFWQR